MAYYNMGSSPFGGTNCFDLSQLLALFQNYKQSGNPSVSTYPYAKNLQSTWGMADPKAQSGLQNAFNGKMADAFGTSMAGDRMMNPDMYDAAKNKFSDFIGGQGTVNMGGLGKAAGAAGYVQAGANAIKDIASWTADIVDSSRSKMALPKPASYNGDTIRSIQDYNMMHEAPHFSHNYAGKKPGFWEHFLDTNMKSIKGMQDGAAFGKDPKSKIIFGAIGGVAGLGFGIGNAIAAAKTYKRNLRNIDRQNDINHINYLDAQQKGITNIGTLGNLSMYYQRLNNPYSLGGQIDSPGLFGATVIGEGGTHEENPNGGVQYGIGQNGKPNLLEEGEVEWNGKVFSARVKPTEDVLKKFNTYMKGGFVSYADIASHILAMHKERENSPFDRRTLEIQMQRAFEAQEYEKTAQEAAEYGLSPEEYMAYQQQAQQYAAGGNIYANGDELYYYDPKTRTIVMENNGDQYLVPIIKGPKGRNYTGGYNPGSSLFYTDYWNRLNDADRNALINEFKEYYLSDQYVPAEIPEGGGVRYNKWATANTPAQTLYNEALNGKWGSAHQAFVDFMYNKMANQPQPVTEATAQPQVTVTHPEQPAPTATSDTYDRSVRIPTGDPERNRHPYYLDWMRAAPALNNLRAILTQNAPDFTYANQLASLYRPIGYKPVGQYQRYQPIDQHYADTQARMHANTLYGLYRNNAQSNNAANYYASLAAADRGAAQNAAYVNAVTADNNARNSVLAYNNSIDIQNEANRFNAAVADYRNYVEQMNRSYAAAEEERLAVEQALEANRTNLAQNIGDIGREMYDRWRINHNPVYSYDLDWNYNGRIPWTWDNIAAYATHMANQQKA